jgi:hypothetical protein
MTAAGTGCVFTRRHGLYLFMVAKRLGTRAMASSKIAI